MALRKMEMGEKRERQNEQCMNNEKRLCEFVHQQVKTMMSQVLQVRQVFPTDPHHLQ
jgi:hypothetical protein